MKKENEAKLEEAINKKTEEIEKKNKQVLQQMKNQHEEEKNKTESRLKQKEKELSSAMEMLKKQSVLLSDQKEKMEKDISEKQQQWEEKLKKEKAELESKHKKLQQQQEELVEQIVKFKKEREYSSQEGKEEREIIDKQWTSLEQIRVTSLDQHKDYVAQFSTNSDKKGVTVPSLFFFDKVFEDNIRNITNFHKMEMIVFPETKNYFVNIDLESLERGSYRKQKNFDYLEKFSNRIIDVTHEIGRASCRERV